jgi:hypothetical protein
MTDAASVGPEVRKILEKRMRRSGRMTPPGCADVLSRYPVLKGMLNEPVGPFDAPVIIHVKSRGLLDASARRWRRHQRPQPMVGRRFRSARLGAARLASYAIERGATVTIHAAAVWVERPAEGVYRAGCVAGPCAAAATARRRCTWPPLLKRGSVD